MNSVLCDQCSNENWRDAFEIAAVLGHGDITTQETFIDTFEEPQESTDICPHAFTGIDVYFPNAIPIIVACPFIYAMIDG
jgi:hypothetical protein